MDLTVFNGSFGGKLFLQVDLILLFDTRLQVQVEIRQLLVLILFHEQVKGSWKHQAAALLLTTGKQH